MRNNRRMPDYPQAAAGARIRARRLLLDTLMQGNSYSSMEAFADLAGSSSRMVADAELGKPVGPKTRLRISRALFWTDDSIDRLYRGEEPIELPDSPTAQGGPTLASTSTGDEATDELSARARELQRRLDLIPEVYDNYGREAAREAIKSLSAELQEVLQELQRRLAEGQGEANSHGHAS